MKPSIKITANENDITEALKDRLLSLKVTDEAGTKSDTCEITLDDRDENMQLPTLKTKLKVSIGYGDSLREMGSYTVDEVTFSLPPATVKIRAKAMSDAPTLKMPRTGSFDQKSVATIVQEIAIRNGLIPIVDPVFQARMVPHIDQTEESDAHFLTRLANLHGAFAKPFNGQLVFWTIGSAALGDTELVITREETISFKATLKDRGNYTKVAAKYIDQDTGIEKTVEVPIESEGGGGSFWDSLFGTGGESGLEYREKRVYGNKEEATWAAQSTGAKLKAGLASCDLTIVGRPDLAAESRVRLSGFRDFTEEQLVINNVTHTLNASGFTTKVTASNGGGN